MGKRQATALLDGKKPAKRPTVLISSSEDDDSSSDEGSCQGLDLRRTTPTAAQNSPATGGGPAPKKSKREHSPAQPQPASVTAWEYVVPSAPALTVDTLPDCASELLMTPQPRMAYKIGEGKYLVLAGDGVAEDRYVVYIRQFVQVAGAGGTARYPSNQHFVKLDAQQAANLLHELPHLRNVMYDGGPRFGVHEAHVGKRLRACLNPEYGPDLDLRQFFLPKDAVNDDDERATKKGIRLSLSEFEALCGGMQSVQAKWPVLQRTEACSSVHAREENQEGLMRCPYCSPTL